MSLFASEYLIPRVLIIVCITIIPINLNIPGTNPCMANVQRVPWMHGMIINAVSDDKIVYIPSSKSLNMSLLETSTGF